MLSSFVIQPVHSSGVEHSYCLMRFLTHYLLIYNFNKIRRAFAAQSFTCLQHDHQAIDSSLLLFIYIIWVKLSKINWCCSARNQQANGLFPRPPREARCEGTNLDVRGVPLQGEKFSLVYEWPEPWVPVTQKYRVQARGLVCCWTNRT